MKKILVAASFILIASNIISGQTMNQITDDGHITNKQTAKKDSTNKKDKDIPIGMYVWTIDKRYGDIKPAEIDTMPHLFMNNCFTNGTHGEYNYLGNLGSARMARIFIDQPEPDQFIFTQPYDYFLTSVDKLNFINTLSPITNITYQNAGSKADGQDRINAIFAVNSGKKLGLGLKFDYLYSPGYYSNQNTSFFNTTLFSSYIGEKYNMHFVFSTNHMKEANNGGISDDNYITHPESFSSFKSDEIPTVLSENWNKNDNLHVYLTHRYNLGFTRKVKMTDAEIKAKKFAQKSKAENANSEGGDKKGKDNNKKNKSDNVSNKVLGRPDNAKIVGNEMPDTLRHNQDRIKVDNVLKKDSLITADQKVADSLATLKEEFVPVTSFIHTLDFNSYDRTYLAYSTPDSYYSKTYMNKAATDSIHDETKYYSIKNTFAIALLEGFNKYAKAGLKVFATHELRHFTLPDATGTAHNIYNEQNLSIGGSLIKTMGKTFHYNMTAETFMLGKDFGQLKIDGDGDANFRFLGDTIQLTASAFFHRLNPGFYYRHYHSTHFWWDDDNLSKEIRTKIEGTLSLKRTKTSLRVALEQVKNYTYFSQSYNIDTLDSYSRNATSIAVKQYDKTISIFTFALRQDIHFGPLIWENEITYQKSSNNDVIPLPTLNIYSNLYLSFRISKVLLVNLGGDVRFFTKYYAPEYSPILNQFCIQGNNEIRTEIGNYPIVNVYANLHLKHTRFYIMMSHINCGSGNNNYFLVAHYPINPMVMHMGISWNFFN